MSDWSIFWIFWVAVSTLLVFILRDLGRPALIDWRIAKMLRPYGLLSFNSYAILMGQNDGFARVRDFKHAVEFSGEDEDGNWVKGYALLNSMFGSIAIYPTSPLPERMGRLVGVARTGLNDDGEPTE